MERKVKYIHKTDVHNLIAPRQVVPLLMQMFQPATVLDVGCGIGTWLSVFKENGVTELQGIDGGFVNKDLLRVHISESDFFAHDLSITFNLKRKFDLVTCLEVAEHLDKKQAYIFIESVCKHSDTIIFSAAVPGQQGQNHLNEQWPAYWINIFKTQGFDCYDILRPLIWEVEEIDWWYKQNMLVFSNKALPGYQVSHSVLPMVHPQHLEQKVNANQQQDTRIRELEITYGISSSDIIGVKTAWKILIKTVRNKFNKMVNV